MRATSLFLAALALAPVGLPAQDEGRDTPAAARIQATLDAAAQAGIPTTLLESKLAEGRAKGVAEARIAAALDARLQLLTRARDAMARGEVESVTAGDLSVAADALEAGVGEEVLLSIQTSTDAESRTVATAVLSSLVLLGRASEEALARVEAALAGGPGALAELRAEAVAGLRARGLGPPAGLGVGVGVGGGTGPGGGGGS